MARIVDQIVAQIVAQIVDQKAVQSVVQSVARKTGRQATTQRSDSIGSWRSSTASSIGWIWIGGVRAVRRRVVLVIAAALAIAVAQASPAAQASTSARQSMADLAIMEWLVGRGQGQICRPRCVN